MTSIRERIADERRREVLEAAYRLYVRRGLAGTTMQHIAAELGLTAGALYRYFPNKDALTEAVFAWCEEKHFAAFDAAERAASPLDAIIEVGRAAWREFDQPDAREDTALWFEATLASYRGDENLAAHADQSFRRAIERMEYGVKLAQDAGQIDPELNSAAVAMTLLATHSGTQHAHLLLNGSIDPHAVLDVAIRMLDGLRPRTADPPPAPSTPRAASKATRPRKGKNDNRPASGVEG